MRSGERKAPLRLAALALIPLIIGSTCGSTGCSPADKAKPGTQARWERKLGWPSASASQATKSAPPESSSQGAKTNRKIADAAPRCLKDRVADPQFLKQEVSRLEQARGGTQVSGAWQSRDLSEFAPPQAQYLSANSAWIATDGLNFAGCKDLPCILNTVYGSGAANQGWKIYYFYLAMGYPLSCRDYVPTTSPRWAETPGRVVFNAPLSAHLFTDAELLSFWKLTYLLPEGYRYMGSQRFHRVPSGNQVPASSWGANTCADSWGNKDHGFIRAKRCLEEDNFTQGTFYEGDDSSIGDNGIRGQFYVTMTHELTHTWDRYQSNGVTAAGFLAQFSDTDDWKNLSGWHEETVISPAPDGSGNTVASSKWRPAAGGDGFVRDYAKSDPREDLAETSAWVRMRPTLVTQRSPRKAAFLSQKVFGGRTYDPAGLTAYYTDSAVRAVTPQLLELVDGCLAQPESHGTGAAIAGAAHLTLDHPLPEAVVACLENELNTRVGSSLDGLRAVEWEACDHLASQEPKVRAAAFDRISADVSHLVSQNIERAPIIRASQQLRLALALQVDPREAYVHCFRQAQPESCYQQALSDAFDRVAQSPDGGAQSFAVELGEALAQEKTSFLSQNPYTQSQARATQFYHQVFAGIEPQVSTVAELRWQGCLGASASPGPLPGVVPQAGVTPLVTPYSGGVHFVAADILNCVNSNYEIDLRAVRDAYISRLGLSVSDPDVQALIQGLLLPGYLDAMRAKQDVAAAAEDADRNRRKPGVLDVLASQLARDQSWLDGALTADAGVSQCSAAAAAAFNDYFSHVSPSEQIPTRFAAIEDVRTSWSHDACVKVVAGPAVSQVLAQRAQKAWSAATSALEKSVAARARDTATDCIARNPGNARTSWAVRNKRHQCLTSAQNWNAIEAQALVDWGQAPEGRDFALSRKADATAYLTSHRKALQAAALTAMDAR